MYISNSRKAFLLLGFTACVLLTVQSAEGATRKRYAEDLEDNKDFEDARDSDDFDDMKDGADDDGDNDDMKDGADDDDDNEDMKDSVDDDDDGQENKEIIKRQASCKRLPNGGTYCTVNNTVRCRTDRYGRRTCVGKK